MSACSQEKQRRVSFNDFKGVRKVNDIHEHYKFEEKLGQGQFGTVYKGVFLKTNTQCAIKIIEKTLAQKTETHWALMKDELSTL